jgi:hypothetical protein
MPRGRRVMGRLAMPAQGKHCRLLGLLARPTPPFPAVLECCHHLLLLLLLL